MSNPSKRRDNPTFWIRLAGTLLTLALLVYLLKEQGWSGILLAMTKISLWQFSLALALQLLSRLAICGRWHVLLRGAKLPVSFAQSSRLTFAGLFATNFLPTTIGGDVVRLAGAIQLRFDSAVSAASLVADRLVGMAGMAMALPFGLPAFSAALQPSAAENITLAATALSRRERFGITAKKWRGRLTGFLQRMFQSLGLWISHPRSLFQALGFTWLHMLCLFASIWLLLNAMGETVSFWLIAGMWSAVYFITLIPISINAYGLQELSLAFIFSQVGGVSPSSALSVAILIRTLFMLASLPGAIFVPGIMAARSSASAGNSTPTAGTQSTTSDSDPGASPE
jgi:hypothetical protein